MGRNLKKQKTTNKYAQLQLDRLSSLPDDILGDILLLLPTKTAVTTSVLSHRWHFLWTQATSLHLNCRDYPLQTSEFYTVVDQLLTRLTSPLLSTFSIRAPYPSHPHFEPWLRHLCSRNVQTIAISFDGLGGLSDVIKTSPFKLTLPHCIFLTQSLVCLNLPSYGIECIFPDDDSNLVIKLPNLKRLRLRLKLRDSQCGFVAKLVRSCPLLEDLTLTASESWLKTGQTIEVNGAVIDISCRNLKHLELNLFWAAVNTRVVIDAPKLDCFALYAFRLASCSFVNKPIKLRKALIDIFSQSQDLVLSLLPGISDITVLDIHGKCFGMFEGCKDDQGNSLTYKNLTELRLQFSSESVDGLDDFSFESTSPTLLIQTKSIKIRIPIVKHGNNFKKLAEHLISNAPSLEKLTFLISSHSSETEGMLGINLDLFSRKFPQCVIEIGGHYACV